MNPLVLILFVLAVVFFALGAVGVIGLVLGLAIAVGCVLAAVLLSYSARQRWL